DPRRRAERLAGAEPEERAGREALAQRGEAAVERVARAEGARVEDVAGDERAAPPPVPPVLHLRDRIPPPLEPAERLLPARDPARVVEPAEPAVEARP